MQPANVLDHLPLVLRGIEKINSKASEHCEPREVIEACLNRQAFLFVGQDAFCVLEPLPGCLNVWLTYAEKRGAVAQYLDFILEKAEQIGATKIQGKLTRKGWMRRLKGWRVTGENTIEVNHGWQ